MSIERLIARGVMKLSYDFLNNVPVWFGEKTGTAPNFLKYLSMVIF
jgi:hypothetical protein